MSYSFIRSVFSGVVSKIEDDTAGESVQKQMPGARLFLTTLMFGVMFVSISVSLVTRLWQRVEMIIEAIQ